VEGTMLKKENNINAKDLKLFEITDDPARVVKFINDFYKKKSLKPNMRL
jgi:sulfur relay (sulfurtransferase) DsrC/TusE family protein